MGVLAASDSEAVAASCSHNKVVRVLTRTVAEVENPATAATVLGVLEVFCR